MQEEYEDEMERLVSFLYIPLSKLYLSIVFLFCSLSSEYLHYIVMALFNYPLCTCLKVNILKFYYKIDVTFEYNNMYS